MRAVIYSRLLLKRLKASGRSCIKENKSKQVIRALSTRVTSTDEEIQWTSRIAIATFASFMGAGLLANSSPSQALEDHAVPESKEVIVQSVKQTPDEDVETIQLLNWSGTHGITVPTNLYFEPENIQQVEQIVKDCFKKSIPLRPVGSGLSPNAIGFNYTARKSNNNSTGAMINLVHLDKILNVDKENMTVTVQAGARVSQVIEALRPYGLTLPNLASIAEQQIGGFIQVGAHGTGARIPPVDEFCTSLTLVTPFMGSVTFSANNKAANAKLQPRLSQTIARAPSTEPLFQVAKVGLGSLGVVTEVSLQCIPAHNLVEHTFVLNRKEAKSQLNTLLKRHKHVRYMWIPYQDAVVVVTNDPEDSVDRSALSLALESRKNIASQSKQDATRAREIQYQALTDLLLKLAPGLQRSQVSSMGFGELRDQLLAINPLDVKHVKLCNEAEANFWHMSQGYQIKPSDQLLQFDCGGQQWVWEICFPTGTYSDNNGNDMLFMEELLKEIEANGIAAHSPIEQRWSASSSSLLSPAHGPPEGLHCWVGIIMYLPNADDETQRKAITQAFLKQYCPLMRKIGQKVNAASHWAKLELPDNEQDIQDLQKHIRQRYPVQYFNHARYSFDPTNLLSNDLINAAFGDPANELGSVKDKPKL